jgi:hypothetical protein
MPIGNNSACAVNHSGAPQNNWEAAVSRLEFALDGGTTSRRFAACRSVRIAHTIAVQRHEPKEPRAPRRRR